MILTTPLSADHPAVSARWKCPRCGKFFEAGDVTAMLPREVGGGVQLVLMCHAACVEKAKEQRERAIAAARPGRCCAVCSAAIEQPGARLETVELCWVCARLRHSVASEAARDAARDAMPGYLKADD